MKLSTRLLRWYDKEGRDLPWRKTRDPYRILVSEMMLQQTQVDRVQVFYRAWFKRFPTWKSLARGSNAQVIRAWAGLGYNRRALALRDIAREVVHLGVPKTEEEWRKLKGIGAYTAAAVSIFAQNKKTLPVDTNVRRVLGRLLLDKPYPQSSVYLPLRAKGSILLGETNRHADLVQALFDLASSHCTKIPDCAACPLRSVCPAGAKFLAGRVKTPRRMMPKPRERIRQGKKYPDRIYRGRILRLVRETSRGVRLEGLGKRVDPAFEAERDTQWLLDMIYRLERDELVIMKHHKLYLS